MIPISLNDERFEGFIKHVLKLHPDGYKLVVLDTVGRAMQGENENSQEHASAFTRLVQRLIRELGCTVLALHHSGHAETARLRGSSVFGADADTMIRLDRNDPYLVEMVMTKQKDAEEWKGSKLVKLQVVRLDPETDSLVVVMPTKDDKPRKNLDELVDRELTVYYILAALRSFGGRHWTRKVLVELTREMGCTQSVSNLEKILGKSGDRGWAKHHEALVPYWNSPGEQWRTPLRIPDIDPKYEYKVETVEDLGF